MLTVKQALKQIHDTAAKNSDSPALDAQVLLAHLMDKDRSWILAHAEAELTTHQQTEMELAVGKLALGVPLPYLIGHWAFFGRDFAITPDVLIPRPETEILVETALEWLRQHPEKRRALDVGTGSGIIALTLAAEMPDLQVTAVDISPPALDVAAQNAAALGVADRVELVESDLLEQVSGEFDLLCANLPYVPSQALRDLAVFEREPTLALDGGADGLDIINWLLDEARDVLAPHALMLFEIEAGQGDSAPQAVRKYFPTAEVTMVNDLAGLPRVVRAEVRRA